MFLPDNAAISLWMGDQKRKSRFHKLKMFAFPASSLKKWDVENLLLERTKSNKRVSSTERATLLDSRFLLKNQWYYALVNVFHQHDRCGYVTCLWIGEHKMRGDTGWQLILGKVWARVYREGEGLESANKESRSVSKSACGGMPCTPGMPPSSSWNTTSPFHNASQYGGREDLLNKVNTLISQ